MHRALSDVAGRTGHHVAGRSVIEQERAALDALAAGLDHSFDLAVQRILDTRGRLVVAGVGKAGHIGRKIAATFSATGSPAFFLHPGEAAHGDLGMVQAGDTLVVLSKSGATLELTPLLRHARAIGAGVLAVTGERQSVLAGYADVALLLPPVAEACPHGIAPTTSSTMMLAMGDALAIATMHARGVSRADLIRLHPGGSIGWRSQAVERLIRRDLPLPLVKRDTSLHDVVLKMTQAGNGVAGVVDDAGLLIGVITDGDLRRGFTTILSSPAEEVMTAHPKMLAATATIADAAALMAEAKVTVLFVTDPHAPRRPVGIVHIHDLAVIC